MNKDYEILRTIGEGLYIEVYNYIGLNKIGHYRFSKPFNNPKSSSSIVGIWKPKLIKN